MSPTETKRKPLLLRWFALCPIRHILLLLSAGIIGAYFLLRSKQAVMTWLCEHLTRPWHRVYSKLCSLVPVSVAALLIAALVIGVLVYIIYALVGIIRHKDRAVRAYRLILSLVALIFAVYAGFCLLWGVYYYTSDFEAQSGLESAPVSTGQLESVTRYFVTLVNTYSAQVSRDEEGLFNEPLDKIFDDSATLYRNVVQLFPCLEGQELKAKPFLFSRAMSYLNFTGFFFPFTGEANINVDSPACLIPSTIAHELAHQRGVAAEDEANFVAVLASLESENPVYCYSAALLAYIHLGNALYRADYDAWKEVYSGLCQEAKADLAYNNAYWDQFETPVSEVSDTVYTGFLHSYGQELGLQSYGACVDLLVAYYYEISTEG